MILNEITIHNFRGFPVFKTSRLSRFTLIAGENDAGKTSLLEAIFMLSGMTMIDIAARLNGFRHLSVIKEEDLHSLFYALETDREISIDGGFEKGLSRHLTFRSHIAKTVQFQPVTDSQLQRANVPLHASFKQKFRISRYGKDETGGELSFLSDAQGVLKEVTQAIDPEHWRCFFLTAKNSAERLANMRKIIDEKREAPIIEMLQMIDSDIKRIVVNGDKIMVDTGLSHLVPVQLLGDGLLKIVNAFAAVMQCENGGLVCIDEIDNGLHFSAMNAFWDHLTKFAADRDVQIVATTHDYDFMNAITAMSDENLKAQFTYLKLVRKVRGGQPLVSAYAYDYAQYESAVASGVELR